MEQKHGEDDISNVDKNLSISVTQYSATLTSRGTISQFLVKLELDQYVGIFKENHIEMKVLLDKTRRIHGHVKRTRNEYLRPYT